MALELAEVQEADLPELARLAVKTWGASTEGLSRHALPLHDPIVMYPWRLRQLVEGFKKDFTKHFKIVDASKGIIVSYASWEHPHQTPSKEASQGGISDSDIPDTFFPAGSNIQMIKDFYNELDRFKAKYVDQTQDYYLRAIFTDPAYQRQGLGSMLMRKSLASIDAEGRRCYLEATRAGLPMYLNLGWKVVDEIRTDVGKYDVAEPYVELTPFMMREAAATQGQK